VNPFSIASRQSDVPSDQQLTAEGFFKNPTVLKAKKEETIKTKNTFESLRIGK
jgi:hypothetical protein